MFCNGLFLEAARWDNDKGELAQSKLGEIYTGACAASASTVLAAAQVVFKFGSPEQSMPALFASIEFPPVHFLPELDHHCDPNKYECPTYKTAIRKGALSTTGMSTNYVVAIELKTPVKPTTWVMAGAALLLNLTD